MSFEGIPRPAQVNPYQDPMSAHQAANAARSQHAGRPMIQTPAGDEKIKGLHREERERHAFQDEDEARGNAFDEEEIEQIMLFARMRGIMNFSLETGARYEFRLNPETGLVDLVSLETRQVVLQLLPDELMQLSQNIQRYAGMLTDRTG